MSARRQSGARLDDIDCPHSREELDADWDKVVSNRAVIERVYGTPPLGRGDWIRRAAQRVRATSSSCGYLASQVVAFLLDNAARRWGVGPGK